VTLQAVTAREPRMIELESAPLLAGRRWAQRSHPGHAAPTSATAPGPRATPDRGFGEPARIRCGSARVHMPEA